MQKKNLVMSELISVTESSLEWAVHDCAIDILGSELLRIMLNE